MTSARRAWQQNGRWLMCDADLMATQPEPPRGCDQSEPFVIAYLDADESASGSQAYVMRCDVCFAEWEEDRP